MHTEIAERITRQMSELGLSIRSLATETGIPHVTLTRRLREPGTFKLIELERLSDALGTNLLDAA